MSTLGQVLAELEMCSHVSAVNLDPLSPETSEDVGGKRPTGGVDRREDRFREVGSDPANERVLRSADHFRRQLARGRPPRFVLAEAQAALGAWKRAAPPVELEYGSYNWKRWVGESVLSDEEIAVRFNVSRRRIAQVRAKYRAAA